MTYGKLVPVSADKSINLLAVLEDHEGRHGLDADLLFPWKNPKRSRVSEVREALMINIVQRAYLGDVFLLVDVELYHAKTSGTRVDQTIRASRRRTVTKIALSLYFSSEAS